ncbi:MAG: DegV family EDD domain-containing protein [Gemmatimonadetes bacterium]|nr:DegV family EDD domain-containing protein [Gemmatimonadota bacterium]
MRIDYLDGERLRRSLIAGCEYVQGRRAELNRINVFPVPDGDTGTNLALTAAAIADSLRSDRSPSVGVIAHRAADAAILGARGNCGMILSHFLLGFSRSVRDRERLDAAEFATSLESAVEHVYRSLDKPVEGTIVTVMREVAEEARDSGRQDYVDLVELMLTRARAALERTPDLLPVLRAAGVVDAGAKGFVHLVEGIVAFVHGDPFVTLDRTPVFDDVAAPVARVEYPAVNERYRFCTEALVRGPGLPGADAVRGALRAHGESLIVIRGDDILKIHIHTDDPESVFAWLRQRGRLVTHKAEDMAAQHAAVERAAAEHVQLARRPITIVADSACNLPDEIVRAHGIHVVPMLVVTADEVLRDGVDIDGTRLAARLAAGERATTSQPPPGIFLEAYRRAAADGETVLAIMVASALSGTFRSAEAASRQLDDAPIRLFDSRTAGLGQGMLVLRAAELAEAGHDADEVLAELDRVRRQSGLLFTVDVFDHLLASGRVGRGKVMIAGLLDIKPILGFDDGGSVGPVANVRGSQNVPERLVGIIADRLPRSPAALRFGIMHVGRPAIVDQVSSLLQRRFGDREIVAAPATPVIATHLGPGAWGVAWQLED